MVKEVSVEAPTFNVPPVRFVAPNEPTPRLAVPAETVTVPPVVAPVALTVPPDTVKLPMVVAELAVSTPAELFKTPTDEEEALTTPPLLVIDVAPKAPAEVMLSVPSLTVTAPV